MDSLKRTVNLFLDSGIWTDNILVSQDLLMNWSHMAMVVVTGFLKRQR